MTLILKINGHLGQPKIACVTDSELIDKKFENEDTILDFTSNFYKGEPKSEEALAKILTAAYMVIFSGNDSIAFGEKLGIVEKDSAIMVGGVPHAQCLIG